MKIRQKYGLVSIALMGLNLVSGNVFANNTDTLQEMKAQMAEMQRKIEAMEQELLSQKQASLRYTLYSQFRHSTEACKACFAGAE